MNKLVGSTQVGSTTEQKLLWVFLTHNWLGQKPAACALWIMRLMLFLLSDTSSSIYFQLAQVKKLDLCCERTTDRPGNRHFFPTTYRRLCMYLPTGIKYQHTQENTKLPTTKREKENWMVVFISTMQVVTEKKPHLPLNKKHYLPPNDFCIIVLYLRKKAQLEKLS